MTPSSRHPEEYQELSKQEEEDLEKLLTRENAIQDAAAFTEHLSEELAHLDQVCVGVEGAGVMGEG